MKKTAILTDVGSTKDYIVSQVNDEIKSTCGSGKSNFIGAHPLAGSEQRGIDSARPDLLKEVYVCLRQQALIQKRA